MPAALRLLKLVHDLEPSLPGVAQRLEAHGAKEKEKEKMAQGDRKNMPQRPSMVRYIIESKTMANAIFDEMKARFRQLRTVVDKVSIGSVFHWFRRKFG